MPCPLQENADKAQHPYPQHNHCWIQWGSVHSGPDKTGTAAAAGAAGRIAFVLKGLKYKCRAGINQQTDQIGLRCPDDHGIAGHDDRCAEGFIGSRIRYGVSVQDDLPYRLKS